METGILTHTFQQLDTVLFHKIKSIKVFVKVAVGQASKIIYDKGINHYVVDLQLATGKLRMLSQKF